MREQFQREYYKARAIVPTYILLALVLVIAGVFTEIPIFFVFLLMDTSALLPIMAIAADEVAIEQLGREDALLPKRRGVVARYLVISSFIAAGSLFGLLMVTINHLYMGILTLSQSFAYVLLFGAFIHIVPSIFLPVLYRFGFRRAALILLALLLLILLGFMYFMPELEFASLSAGILWKAAGLTMAASTVLFFLSGAFSVLIFRQKRNL